SIKTVETHRAHIMNKLDIHDQVTLTRFALKHKITL
ncbi:DNA-binding response regulator, partial [Candidatus Parcubacteria bacterium]